ncbi:MAG: hypothetical protein GDA49_00420 [Rhodospirillales bacterium]|nr:hypothetical protein [Rhodospirillales bacterium]
MELYGLRSITHGWGRLLHIVSPEGARAVFAHLDPDDACRVVASPGAPVQVHQGKGGTIDDLVARYGIVELNLADWERKKSELGADLTDCNWE